MIIHDCVQCSDEWWELRRGVPTASDFGSIITAKGKRCVLLACHEGEHIIEADGKKPASRVRCQKWLPTVSKGATTYIAKLIADTACLTPNYFSAHGVSRPMQNGKDMEPEARRFYALERGVDVIQAGFITTDDGRFGASPDAVIEEKGELVGGLELKCVNRETLVKWHIEGQKVPLDHRQQVHGGLVVTGLQWWDFLGYSPGVEPLLVRQYPDDYTVALKSALEDFWARYQELKARLIQREPGCEA